MRTVTNCKRALISAAAIVMLAGCVGARGSSPPAGEAMLITAYPMGPRTRDDDARRFEIRTAVVHAPRAVVDSALRRSASTPRRVAPRITTVASEVFERALRQQPGVEVVALPTIEAIAAKDATIEVGR